MFMLISRLESAVFRSKLPTHGKSRKLSAIGNNNQQQQHLATVNNDTKNIDSQQTEDVKKCACG